MAYDTMSFRSLDYLQGEWIGKSSGGKWVLSQKRESLKTILSYTQFSLEHNCQVQMWLLKNVGEVILFEV
jgi:hypothetical protein